MANGDDTPTDRALELHRLACQRHEAGYIDPDSGLFVMTSWYLHETGSCCGSGCRHCPFSRVEQQAAARPPHAGAWPWPPRGHEDG